VDKRLSWLARLKRNHALEHATIYVLSQRHWGLHVIGRSDPWGFTLTGEVGSEDVAAAVSEALARLQHGEKELAVHPRCGTNLAVSALLAGLSSFVVMGGKTGSRWEKFPRVLLATLGALLVAQPLGLLTQQYITTNPNLADAEIKEVIAQRKGRMTSHRVTVEYAI
jgi:hypothetical protein